MTKGPVLIDIDEPQAPSPADAQPVPDLAPTSYAGETPQGQAMQTVAVLAARRPSRLAKAFWGLLAAVLSAAVSLALWDFVTGLIARNLWLGYAVTGLLFAFGVVCAAILLRELAGFSRLKRIDRLHSLSEAAQASGDLGQARAVVSQLRQLYARRDDLRWAQERFVERADEQFDSDSLLALAENELLSPLDQAAMREVETAARQVATVTALVPLAFADVIAALTANIRMIRRIAEIYGGRSGTLGTWRLTRAVMTHLVATGAVAIGDDLLGSLAGGGVLSKLSRRFGEGLVNGALTARVGVAAMEVCRPLPFQAARRPSVSGLVKRALTGLFSGSGEK
ncbi:MAG: TIGR01620 family protein [Pseudomonadota bacterium]